MHVQQCVHGNFQLILSLLNLQYVFSTRVRDTLLNALVAGGIFLAFSSPQSSPLTPFLTEVMSFHIMLTLNPHHSST